MRLLSDISPGWLKALLLTYGVVFISYGLLALPSEQSSDFFLHILAVIVEISIGTFIALAVIEEVIRRDKDEKMFIILHTENIGIGNFTYFILYISLINFIPVIPEIDKRNLMRDKLQNMPPNVIPNTTTLNAMWDGFKLWEELFFFKDTINPKGDYPQIISNTFKDIKRPLNYLRKINSRLENVVVTEDQLMTLYAFETSSNLVENEIEDLSTGKSVNLMVALRSLLISSIHLYALSSSYLESLPKVEVVEFYKHGFKFSIRKMKWWL